MSEITLNPSPKTAVDILKEASSLLADARCNYAMKHKDGKPMISRKQRARVLTLRVRELLKEFRKLSLEEAKVNDEE